MADSTSSSSSGSSASASRVEVPQRDLWLVAVRIPAGVVDRAEHGGRVEGVHERARPEVDALTGDGHVVGVHDTVDEPDEHPLRDQRGLGVDDAVQQREVGILRLRRIGVVPRDRVVRQTPQQGRVVAHGRVLERPDAEVARRNPDEHRTRLQALPHHLFASGHDCQRPASWGCRARGAPRRSGAPATSARGRPSRRRLGRRACDRSPSGARRDGVHECRAPHRAATRGRHRVEATRNRTDDRRTPAPRVTRPRARRLRASRATPSGDRNVAGSTPSSSARPSLSATSWGAGAGAAFHGTERPGSSRANELSNWSNGRVEMLTIPG